MNQIILGDSLKLMGDLPSDSIDLIVTDPPYIVDTSITVENLGSTMKSIGKLCGSDIEAIGGGFDIDLHLKEWERVLKKFNAFIFCSNKQISSLMKWGEDRGYVTTCLVWWKHNAPPLCNGNWISNIEYCIHIRQKGATFQGNNKVKSKVHRESIVRSEFDHPTVKPLELVKNYIKIGSNEGDIVLDPFVGSGTTVNGAIQLNRNYIAYEIEEKYHKIACNREQRAKGNAGLFAT